MPAVWFGFLIAIAAVAAPAAFAILTPAEAGRVVARVLQVEAYASLGAGVAMALLERRHAAQQARAGDGSIFGPGLLLALGALFCTIAASFGVQPLMRQARIGAAAFSFAQLHAASVALFALKALLVGALAWRAAGGR